MKIELDQRVAMAIAEAVHYAINTLGVSALRATSMFPSTGSASVDYKIAA
jgi:hypothetical protein